MALQQFCQPATCAATRLILYDNSTVLLMSIPIKGTKHYSLPVEHETLQFTSGALVPNRIQSVVQKNTSLLIKVQYFLIDGH